MRSLRYCALNGVSFNFFYVQRGDVKVFLPPIQMGLFTILVDEFQEVVPKQRLIEMMPSSSTENLGLMKLRVHLKKLREKLEEINIKVLSQYNRGYLLCDQDKAEVYKRVLCRNYDYIKKVKQGKERGNEDKQLQGKGQAPTGLGGSTN